MNRQEQLKAITERNKQYDGKFYYGVKTTKIVCNPGCPAKLPLEKNIVLLSVQNALKAFPQKGNCLVNPSEKTRKALQNGAIWKNTVSAKKRAGNRTSLITRSR